MKILITGGAGFVGKNLIEQLGEGFELLHPNHQELDLLNEHTVGEYLRQNKPNAVIHCANVGATKKTDNLPHIVSNNLRMFLNLARQQEHYKKMLFFGSGAEFDKRQELKNVTEDFKSPTLPESDYGFSKALCSHFLQHYPKIITLRIFGVYGKYDDYLNRFVSNAICRAVLGLPIVIYQDQLMDFIYVDDLVKVVKSFLINESQFQDYNVSSGNSIKLTEIAKIIKEVSGKSLEIKILKSGMAPQYTCSTERLKIGLKDLEFTDMRESLINLYSWYNQNSQLIDQKKFA